VDRRQLLGRIDRAWLEFKYSYSGLSESQLLEPGVTDGWSIRDVIAHVTTWEEEALAHLPLILEGGRPPRYAVAYGGIDAFNNLAMERKRDVSLAEVLRQQQDSHRRLVHLVERAPEDQLTRDTRFLRRLRLDSYSHYAIHAKAICNWRKQRMPIGPRVM
jgi:DinB superfamily